MAERITLQRVGEVEYRLEQRDSMNAPGTVFANASMIEQIDQDNCLEQVANVACLPGIVEASLAMPDIHAGYGFPIGGVAAFDPTDGVVSPGGVGYDINCGVRLLRTSLPKQEVLAHLDGLSGALFRAIPSGIGSTSHVSLTSQQLCDVLEQGAAWAVGEGYGTAEDLQHTEEEGTVDGALVDEISERARQRGLRQLGSLGSGNHFVEVAWVAEVYDKVVAHAFGLVEGHVTVMLHTGSRGLGYQVCDDSLPRMWKASQKYGIHLPDRQLCAAPLASPEAQAYLGAMNGAINFAFANRQMLTHFVRQAFTTYFNDPSVALPVVYDVSHNIAKWEDHVVQGKTRRLCVHRKGATRAFPAGHPDIPADYRSVGQPVLVPGDMGRYSYVLVGTDTAMQRTWGSICHGAGRRLSRRAASKLAKSRNVAHELQERGVWVRASSNRTVNEEIPEAYKDVQDVVDVAQTAGLARKVARLEPLAVVKG